MLPTLFTQEKEGSVSKRIALRRHSRNPAAVASMAAGFSEWLLLAHPNCRKPVCRTVFALWQTTAAETGGCRIGVDYAGSENGKFESGAVKPQICRKGRKRHCNNDTPKEQRFLLALRTLSFPVVCLKPRIERLWGCGSDNAVVSVLHYTSFRLICGRGRG